MPSDQYLAKSARTGLIIRQREPLNLEFPFEQLESFLTPVESFYVRSHFSAPVIDPAQYRLRVNGAISNPFELALDELRNFPSETRVATLECAGNSRVFLVPQTEGAQWQLGAVGTAEWTGVPLSALLQRASLNEDACEVVLEGADRGKPKEKPKPPREISYARSIPLEKAVAPETLIAYQMNGEDLPRDHGYPVRAIVPGHYGMASVKWLTGIRVLREPFHGYWQTSEYAFWDHVDGMPVRRALSKVMLKSAIARPAMHESVPAGQRYSIYGAAWSDGAAVTVIEVSTDGGASWEPGEFLDPAQPFAWRRWQYRWEIPAQPGRRVLMARATDASGAMQPLHHDPSYGSYAIHHALPIEVFIR